MLTKSLSNLLCHIRVQLCTFQISDKFLKVIMHCDVMNRVICISNKVEYFEKEKSQRNSIKEVTLSFLVILAMQSINSWTKFRFIDTLISQLFLHKMQFSWL